jgi:hypothetical protein
VSIAMSGLTGSFLRTVAVPEQRTRNQADHRCGSTTKELSDWPHGRSAAPVWKQVRFNEQKRQEAEPRESSAGKKREPASIDVRAHGTHECRNGNDQ